MTVRLLSLLLLFSCILSATMVSACSKEEYAARFGVTPLYELQTTPAPMIDEDGFLTATVTYASDCGDGGSEFSVDTIEKPGFEMNVLLLRRDSLPDCKAPSTFGGGEQKYWTGVVRAKVPVPRSSDPSKMSVIAFPPDGAYEIFMLDDERPLGQPKRKADAEEEAVVVAKEAGESAVPVVAETNENGDVTAEEVAKVREELSTQSEEDSRNHLAHCEANPGTGCCTPYMVAELRKKVSTDDANDVKGAEGEGAQVNNAVDVDESLSPKIADGLCDRGDDDAAVCKD